MLSVTNNADSTLLGFHMYTAVSTVRKDARLEDTVLEYRLGLMDTVYTA